MMFLCQMKLIRVSYRGGGGGGRGGRGNFGGWGGFPPPQKIFVEFGLSEVDFRYNFDVYTHAAVTFWVYDAISIDSTNSQSIQLILQNSWWGGNWTLGNLCVHTLCLSQKRQVKAQL